MNKLIIAIVIIVYQRSESNKQKGLKNVVQTEKRVLDNTIGEG